MVVNFHENSPQFPTLLAQERSDHIMSESIPVATAVPVTTTIAAEGVVVAHATHGATPAVIVSPQGNYIIQQEEDGRFGICRKCRRRFQRPAGVNDGQASYYRCAECERSRLDDYIASCNIH